MAGDNDAISAKLATAKTMYKMDLDNYRKAIVEYFNKSENDARKELERADW